MEVDEDLNEVHIGQFERIFVKKLLLMKSDPCA